MDQFLLKKEKKPPDQSCSKDCANTLKRKKKEEVEIKEKKKKKAENMSHAPWWNDNTQQLSWMFPVDGSYSSNEHSVGWIKNEKHVSSSSFPLYTFATHCSCHEKNKCKPLPRCQRSCWRKMNC